MALMGAEGRQQALLALDSAAVVLAYLQVVLAYRSAIANQRRCTLTLFNRANVQSQPVAVFNMRASQDASQPDRQVGDQTSRQADRRDCDKRATEQYTDLVRAARKVF